MLGNVTVGKNTATIGGFEFPIDNDLRVIELDESRLAWRVDTLFEIYPFKPLIGSRVTTETFHTYKTALTSSEAFDSRGKMKQMLNRKEEGVRIIPGHGVFIMPSKMTIMQCSPTDLAVRVFRGSTLEKVFRDRNYERLVSTAHEYYLRHIRDITSPVNENLYYPVEYMTKDRTGHLPIMPKGVYVEMRGDSFNVYYSASSTKHHYASTTKRENLTHLIEGAAEARELAVKGKAMYRFVQARYVPMSQYLETI